jgi:hypothetical protein
MVKVESNQRLGICCFSTKQYEQRPGGSESGYCFRGEQHVYYGLLFQSASIIKIQLSMFI